jgi:hypothetical protein
VTGADAAGDLARAESDVIRDRTDALVSQSLLLVGELRTRSRQLEDLVADLAARTQEGDHA